MISGYVTEHAQLLFEVCCRLAEPQWAAADPTLTQEVPLKHLHKKAGL